ncbi:aspartate carbamoyltransferase catalytic subunit [Sphingomicrobium lutaoense]|uniref:Aspartate carbamoyltransferase n=1 Tax=Sphingomicrobium lutaoense TaxID=515949 RepID=A0A839Z1G5_9SPHN|nr:aspartate carbamoyltransferase catalytic subunit [Sphingomicrobium lutaoense]MBB3763553.1 aspartate carbamoyltransferase catalytic subunit [Sphingomicrobium lutaoense]
MDLLSTRDLSDEQLDYLLDAASHWLRFNKQLRKSDDRLAGMTVLTAFFENSTRTLMSFDIAARRLGAMVSNLPVDMSSLAKGESLHDTAVTLDAMRPDVLVLRHSQPGAPRQVADWMDCPVVNAGDGTGEHPTQGLLDVATIKQHFGRAEGLTVAICGDIRHSRVANSTRDLLERMGANVRLAGPAALMPEGHDGPDGIDDAVRGADVVMMLRVQRERLESDLGDAPGEYLSRYGLTADRLALAAPSAMVMHPGPMNRDVEIEGAIADGDRSLIRQQVEMGVAMRMAVLDLVTIERRSRAPAS